MSGDKDRPFPSFVGSPHPTLPAYAAATLAACLMGLMGVFVRHLPLSDETIALARFSLGLLFLVVFLLVSSRYRQLTGRLSLSPILSGIFIALCMLCYIKAIKLTTLATAAFLLYLGPLLAVAASFVLLGERLTRNGGLLILAAFLGCALIVGVDIGSSETAWRGNLFGLGAGLFYALFIVTNRMIPADITLLTRAGYQLLSATLVLLPFADPGSIAACGYTELLWTAALGFTQGFLSVTLMIVAIGHLQTYQYGTISYLEPVVAALAGLLLYDETILWRQALGGLIIVTSGITQTLLSVKTNA